jgi:hypothetical protein
MSEVPYRKAGAATLDLRGQQEQQRLASRGLRAIELLHNEWWLLGELALLARRSALLRRRQLVCTAQSTVALDAIIFVCVVGVVQW